MKLCLGAKVKWMSQWIMLAVVIPWVQSSSQIMPNCTWEGPTNSPCPLIQQVDCAIIGPDYIRVEPKKDNTQYVNKTNDFTFTYTSYIKMTLSLEPFSASEHHSIVIREYWKDDADNGWVHNCWRIVVPESNATQAPITVDLNLPTSSNSSNVDVWISLSYSINHLPVPDDSHTRNICSEVINSTEISFQPVRGSILLKNKGLNSSSTVTLLKGPCQVNCSTGISVNEKCEVNSTIHKWRQGTELEISNLTNKMYYCARIEFEHKREMCIMSTGHLYLDHRETSGADGETVPIPGETPRELVKHYTFATVIIITALVITGVLLAVVLVRLKIFELVKGSKQDYSSFPRVVILYYRESHLLCEIVKEFRSLLEDHYIAVIDLYDDEEAERIKTNGQTHWLNTLNQAEYIIIVESDHAFIGGPQHLTPHHIENPYFDSLFHLYSSALTVINKSIIDYKNRLFVVRISDVQHSHITDKITRYRLPKALPRLVNSIHGNRNKQLLSNKAYKETQVDQLSSLILRYNLPRMLA